MSFYLEEECEVSFDFAYRDLAGEIVDFCLEHLKFPYEAEVNLTLTDNDGIHEINRIHRGIDRPTDVLSFPMLSYTAPGDFRFLEEENEDDFNPDTGEAILGDIVISVDKVKEQAESFGHSEKRELSFLVVHGLLHLLGYDHMNADDEKKMFDLQELILSEQNIKR